MAYRKFLRRPRRKILRRRTTKRAKTVSTAVKRYVKRTIHRNIENKEILAYGQNTQIQTPSVGVGMSNFSLIPPIAQGVQNNQRIGNSVKIVRGAIKGYMNLLPYDAATNPNPVPCLCKIWLVRYLATNQALNFLPSGTTDLFFKGNGISLPPQGTALDMCLSVNDDLFRVLASKTFELGATYPSATGPIGTSGYYDNSKITLPFYFNWSKWVKKNLKFDDSGGASNYPTNENLYIFFEAVTADGRAGSPYKMTEIHYNNHVKFEDA